MKKEFIKNRKGEKMAVLLNEVKNPDGLAFVMHGLGGFKEQKHLQVMVGAFLENNYMVVRFDTTNSLGESDGVYADATTTNYYEDLEDFINWAKQQNWYREPFVLAGHSLGSFCIALYAENHSEEVKALAPISTVVSGELSVEAKKITGESKEWEQTGWRINKSISKPGVIKRLKWNQYVEDILKYDLLPGVGKLTMPVLLIVGELDKPEYQHLLYSKLSGKKELHIVKGSPHTFRTKEHLEEVRNIFKNWIGKI